MQLYLCYIIVKLINFESDFFQNNWKNFLRILSPFVLHGDFERNSSTRAVFSIFFEIINGQLGTEI